MRRTGHRLYRVVTRLALVAATGVLFQTTGCSVTSSGLASDFTTLFINSVITSYVNRQMGVQSSLFF
jgi:hypothetical protein